MRYARFLLVALPAVALSGAACAPAEDPEEPAAEQAGTTEADAEAIRGLLSSYLAALDAGDAGQYAAVFTDDGVLMVPNAPPANGRGAINVQIQAAFAQTDFESHAFARGTLTGTTAAIPDGEPVESTRSWVMIFQRQPEGSWGIARYILNSDSPPPSSDE
jgi:ketosteroid isomerase-like protein